MQATMCALCLAASALAQVESKPPTSQAPVRSSLDQLSRAALEFEVRLDGSKLVNVEFDARGRRILVATQKRLLCRDLEAKKNWEPQAPRYGFADASFASDDEVVIASRSTASLWQYGAREASKEFASADDLHYLVLARSSAPSRVSVALATAGMVPGDAEIYLRRHLENAEERVVSISDRWGARNAQLSASGRLLAVLCGSGPTMLVRTKDGKILEKLDYYYKEPDEKGTRGGWAPTSFAFSHDERVLFIADSRGFVRAWDIDKRRELVRWRASTKGEVQSITLGPSRDILFSFHADGTRTPWLVRQASKPKKLAMPELAPGRLVFGPKRGRFATVTSDRVRVWKLKRR